MLDFSCENRKIAVNLHNNVRFYITVIMGHLERKQREKEQIRKNILEAALTLAKSGGWNAVTIRKIAEAIEYTPPIVYEYFQNKDDLFWEIILLGFQKLLKQGKKHIEKTDDPKEQLLMVSLAHWDFAFENRELYQLMFSLERPYPNEEAQRGIIYIRGMFSRLSGLQGIELEKLVFNWLCLLNGTISMVMQFEVPECKFQDKFSINPRDLYIEYMQRFISGVSHR